AARLGGRRRWPCREYCGRRGDVEQGTGLRAPLVSARPHRARNAASLDGRQAPRHAVARTAGAIGSLLLLRLRVLDIRRFVVMLTKHELIQTVRPKETRNCH